MQNANANVYSKRQVLCKKKTFVRKKIACKHINTNGSFVLTLMLKKPLYCHSSQAITGSFGKYWKKF